MRINKNIYLVGFMGAGKTHAGRELALGLGRPFLDLDRLIETERGRTIAELFATAGEAAFRLIERDALRATAASPLSVVATGGGAPCYHEGMDWLLANGLVVFLDPPVEVLLERLERGRAHRPLLSAAEDLRREVTVRLAERRPVYARAHLTLSEPQAVARLLRCRRVYGRATPPEDKTG